MFNQLFNPRQKRSVSQITLGTITLFAARDTVEQSVPPLWIYPVYTVANIETVIPARSNATIRRLTAVNTVQLGKLSEIFCVQTKIETALQSIRPVNTKKRVESRLAFTQRTNSRFTLPASTRHFAAQAATAFKNASPHLIWITHCFSASASTSAHSGPASIFEPSITSNSESSVMRSYRVMLFNSRSKAAHGTVATYLKPFTFTRRRSLN